MNTPWLYYLLNSALESYFVNRSAGNFVDTTITETPLPETPEGWQDLAIGYERNMQKVGLVRNFSVPLSFVKDGARILRKLFFTGSIENKVTLLIRKMTMSVVGGTYQRVYNDFYSGEIDLSSVKVDGDKATASIAETGIQKQLKANESTMQELPVDDDPEKIIVRMDGIYLHETHNFDTGAFTTPADHLVQTLFVNKEGQAPGVATFTVYLVNGPAISPTSEDYFMLTSQAITGMVLSGSFDLSSNSPDKSYQLRLKSSTGQNILIDTFSLNSTRQTYTWNVTFNAAADERFWLYAFFTPATGGINHYAGSFSLAYTSKFQTTYCNALLDKTVFERLSTKVLGFESVESSVLDSSTLALSCGDAVRGISGAKIKTSLSNFIEYSRVVHAAGFGIEGELMKIEAFADFLTESSPIALGEVKNVKTYMATDLMANTVKIGYPDKSIDDVNGKYEFNNTHVYSSPLTRVIKEHTLVSPYAAQPYYIETKRIQFTGKTTTDNSADNDVIILDVEPITISGVDMSAYDFFGIHFIAFIDAAQYYDDIAPGARITISGASSNNGTFTVIEKAWFANGTDFSISVVEAITVDTITGATVNTGVYKLRRPAYDSISGVPDTVNIFNVELSPKRLLIKHGTWLNSILHSLSGQLLTFKTTEKNPELSTTQGATTIQEKADFPIGPTQLFKPYYHDLETKVPVALVSLLEANPNRPFSFIDEDGDTFIGFLIKGGIAPDDNKEQSFKLLSAPSNDLSKFE